jgi:hypothetical protein
MRESSKKIIGPQKSEFSFPRHHFGLLQNQFLLSLLTLADIKMAAEVSGHRAKIGSVHGG